MLRLVYFLALVLSVNSASAPFIKPCKSGDTACVTASARGALPALAPGVPELAVRPLDPLRLARIHSDDNGLKLTFTDSVLTGLKGCAVESVKFDAVKKKQSASVKCNVVLKGTYKLDGQLLILPVQGHGKYKIDLNDLVIKVTSDIATNTGKDGKEHWRLSKSKHSYSVKKNAHFDFENLFNGNKALAEPVLEFANSNWSEVMEAVAPPVVQAIVTEVLKTVNELYEAVPAEELYIA